MFDDVKHFFNVADESIQKETPMANFHFSVPCPCGSGTVVGADDTSFSATTVTVAACPQCQREGIVSREMRKSWAYENEVLGTTYRHRNGLVVFS